MPKYKAIYALTRQPTVKYGRNVENIGGVEAVRKNKPNTVNASWFTHEYTPERHELGGNEIGVAEHRILKDVDNYIFIDASDIHLEKKPIFLDIEADYFTSGGGFFHPPYPRKPGF